MYIVLGIEVGIEKMCMVLTAIIIGVNFSSYAQASFCKVALACYYQELMRVGHRLESSSVHTGATLR